MLLNLVLALATAAAALPTVNERQLAAGPAVTIHDGTVVGSTFAGIDTFKGIPFAQPPTGTLRLRLPQTLTAPYGVLIATAEPTACPQFFSQINTTTLPGDAEALLLNSPISQQIQNAGEDCLTLNVQRPAGTTSSSKLPVVFWICKSIIVGGANCGANHCHSRRRFRVRLHPVVRRFLLHQQVCGAR